MAIYVFNWSMKGKNGGFRCTEGEVLGRETGKRERHLPAHERSNWRMPRWSSQVMLSAFQLGHLQSKTLPTNCIKIRKVDQFIVCKVNRIGILLLCLADLEAELVLHILVVC